MFPNISTGDLTVSPLDLGMALLARVAHLDTSASRLPAGTHCGSISDGETAAEAAFVDDLLPVQPPCLAFHYVLLHAPGALRA